MAMCEVLMSVAMVVLGRAVCRCCGDGKDSSKIYNLKQGYRMGLYGDNGKEHGNYSFFWMGGGSIQGGRVHYYNGGQNMLNARITPDALACGPCLSFTLMMTFGNPHHSSLVRESLLVGSLTVSANTWNSGSLPEIVMWMILNCAP